MPALTHARTIFCRKPAFALIGAAALTAFVTAPLHAQMSSPVLVPPAADSSDSASPASAPASASAAPTLPVILPAASPASGSKMPIKASVAVRISTLGLGLEASALVTPNVAVRIGYNGYTYNHTETYQGVDYDGKLKLSSVPVYADLYPSKHSGFHATAGLLFNSNNLTAHGKPNVNGNTQTFTLNGNVYNVSDVGSLDGRVSFSKTSPYLGIGFGKPSGGGSMLQFLFDVGVVFQGKPKLSLSRSGGTNDPTLSAVINNAISAQRDKTQSDVNKFQYYPVISFGVAYHF